MPEKKIDGRMTAKKEKGGPASSYFSEQGEERQKSLMKKKRRNGQSAGLSAHGGGRIKRCKAL